MIFWGEKKNNFFPSSNHRKGLETMTNSGGISNLSAQIVISKCLFPLKGLLEKGLLPHLGQKYTRYVWTNCDARCKKLSKMPQIKSNGLRGHH